jgi:hypothetical protein
MQETAGKAIINRTKYLEDLSEGHLKYEFKYLSSRILKHFIGVFHAYKGGGGLAMIRGGGVGRFYDGHSAGSLSRSTLRNDLINDSSKQLLEMVAIRGLMRKPLCVVL